MKKILEVIFFIALISSTVCAGYGGGSGSGTATSIASGEYLNDVKVSTAGYAVNAGYATSAGVGVSTSMAPGEYFNDVKVSSAIYADTAGNAVGAVTAGSSTTFTGTNTFTKMVTISSTAVVDELRIAPSATQVGEIDLNELSGNGENYTGFKSTDALAGNVVYILPPADGNAGDVLSTGGNTELYWTAQAAAITDSTGTISAVLGSSITSAGNLVGLEVWARVPRNMTIKGWYVKADQSGDVEVIVSTGTGAGTTWTAISGTEHPTLSSQNYNSDTSLTTWTTLALQRGDYIRFIVNTAATIKQLTIDIEVWK